MFNYFDCIKAEANSFLTEEVSRPRKTTSNIKNPLYGICLAFTFKSLSFENCQSSYLKSL